MGSIVVAHYAPQPDCAAQLLQLVRQHLPPLRAEGLVTAREPVGMRAADGTLVEIFEWVSQEAIARAHDNPAVRELWGRVEALCTYKAPAELPELQSLFGHFEPV